MSLRRPRKPSGCKKVKKAAVRAAKKSIRKRR